MNLQYDRLKQIIPMRFQRAEHYTEASALTDNLVGYSIHDNYDELPVLTFDKFHENDWKHATYYLNTHYTANMTNSIRREVWSELSRIQRNSSAVTIRTKRPRPFAERRSGRGRFASAAVLARFIQR